MASPQNNALYFAAQSGALADILRLIPLCDAKKRHLDGMTALMMAVMSQSLPCVEALIPASDLLSSNSMGDNAIGIAARLPCPRILQALLGEVSGANIDSVAFGAFMIAAAAGQHRHFSFLATPENLSRLGPNGCTPLINATVFGPPEALAAFDSLYSMRGAPDYSEALSNALAKSLRCKSHPATQEAIGQRLAMLKERQTLADSTYPKKRSRPCGRL